MKFFCRAACLFFAAAIAVHAAASREEEEIITDFGTDDFVYIPKMTLNIGIRSVSGPKASFKGQGVIASTQDFGVVDGKPGNRNYHDGFVREDARYIVDSNGNGQLVSPDGKTNVWAYLDPKQLRDDGLLELNSYSATTTDSSTRSRDLGNSFGLELTLMRDMGKLFNTKATWALVAGISVNDLNASMSDNVAATVRTVTDYYNLDGQKPPDAPYYAPSSASTSVLDSSGNPILDPSTGLTQTQVVDNSTLLGNTPLDGRKTTTEPNNTTSVKNIWRLKGAYMTLRLGPTVVYPISEHFSASFGLGASLVYAGSTYTVVQTFKPATSDDIVDFMSDGVSEFLPGIYVDANLNYTMTENAGAYLGASFQSNGDYLQSISNTTSAYSTRVDLSRMQGFRAGMTFKF
jgi:hypothetical protein